MVALGDLPDGSFESDAYGVSSDGSTLVGFGRGTSGAEAFRWTSAGGMVGLGDLAGGVFGSVAYGVSGDGSVVVGVGNSGSGAEAFIWDAAHGMRSLTGVLVDDYGLGAALTGWTPVQARAISSDGLTIAGYGTNPSGATEAWRAQLDPPAPVPEPGTLLLLGSGLAGLGVRAWRRRRK